MPKPPVNYRAVAAFMRRRNMRSKSYAVKSLYANRTNRILRRNRRRGVGSIMTVGRRWKRY